MQSRFRDLWEIVDIIKYLSTRILQIAKPFYALLVVFEWKKAFKEFFQNLKEDLVITLILRAPN